MDCGDNVIIINAEKVRFTGKKTEDKKYIRHTGYPGGQRETTPAKLFERGKSEDIIMHAVKGMLPKNRLGRAILKNLRVYAGSEHTQEAQQPKELNLNSLK